MPGSVCDENADQFLDGLPIAKRDPDRVFTFREKHPVEQRVEYVNRASLQDLLVVDDFYLLLLLAFVSLDSLEQTADLVNRAYRQTRPSTSGTRSSCVSSLSWFPPFSSN